MSAIRKLILPKYTHVQAYDYHPPLGLPDSEAPEQSLGDCSICMDAIMVDNPLKKRSKSFDVRDDFDDKGGSRSGLRKGKSVLDAMQRNVGASAARKNYSLAPCSHIFVSRSSHISTSSNCVSVPLSTLSV